MEIFATFSTAILLSFVLSLIFSPVIIKTATKIKFNQPVYEYVVMHQKKSGTPTMGGLIFVIAITISSLLVTKSNNKLVFVSVAVMLGFGLIGFLDDYIKIKFNHNEGLKPYQKILGQLIVAIIISVYAYNSNLVSGEIFIPFTTKAISLNFWYIPFMVIFFLAITNSVNLTDGLDGLAGGVSLGYIICFSFIFYIILNSFSLNGIIVNKEYYNMFVFLGTIIGALLGYLLFNSHPASIFMGDTGSLALGGLLGSVAILTKTVLIVPLLGIMFVISSVSVIIQVLYYKRTKKRVFLMAPFHHHLEKKSMYETKIVAIYIIVTMIAGTLCAMLQLLLNKM